MWLTFSRGREERIKLSTSKNVTAWQETISIERFHLNLFISARWMIRNWLESSMSKKKSIAALNRCVFNFCAERKYHRIKKREKKHLFQKSRSRSRAFLCRSSFSDCCCRLKLLLLLLLSEVSDSLICDFLLQMFFLTAEAAEAVHNGKQKN